MKIPSVSEFREHQLIPHPCHLRWEDLDLRVDGVGHCSACDCEVRDLTDMNSEEIYALQEQLGGKLCGMIYKKNNDVATEVEKEGIGESNNDEYASFTIPIPKVISVGLSSAVALSLASCSTTDPRETVIRSSEADPFPKDVSNRKPKKTKVIPEEECLLGIIAAPPKR